MKKTMVGIFSALIITTGAFAMDYDEAKTQDKPMMIMFKMQRCGACKEFSPKFDNYAAKFSNKYNFLKEDIDSSKIASRFKFGSVPAFFILNPKTNKSKEISYDCATDDGCFTKALTEYKY